MVYVRYGMVIGLCVLCFSGCSSRRRAVGSLLALGEGDFLKRHKKASVRREEVVQEHSRTVLREWETALSDIPFPLGAVPVENQVSFAPPEGQFMAYAVTLTEEELVIFYEQEMERLGWQKEIFLRAIETIITFSKPDRFCVVSLRKNKCTSQNQKKAKRKEVAAEGLLVVLSIGKKSPASKVVQEQGSSFYDEDFS